MSSPLLPAPSCGQSRMRLTFSKALDGYICALTPSSSASGLGMRLLHFIFVCAQLSTIVVITVYLTSNTNYIIQELHITLCIRKIKLLCISMSMHWTWIEYIVLYVTIDHTTRWVLVTLSTRASSCAAHDTRLSVLKWAGKHLLLMLLVFFLLLLLLFLSGLHHHLLVNGELNGIGSWSCAEVVHPCL